MIENTLREALKVHHVTETELAKGARVDYNTVLRWCDNSTKGINLSMLNDICEYLNCSVDDILKFESSKKTARVEMSDKKYQKENKEIRAAAKLCILRKMLSVVEEEIKDVAG